MRLANELIRLRGFSYPPNDSGSTYLSSAVMPVSADHLANQRKGRPLRRTILPLMKESGKKGKGLTPEEISLWKNFAEEPDPERKKWAKEAIFGHYNRGIVEKKAREQLEKYSFLSPLIELQDLEAEGFEAFMRCINKFDYKKNNQFSTYLSPAILHRMKRYIKNISNAFQIPEDIYSGIQRAIAKGFTGDTSFLEVRLRNEGIERADQVADFLRLRRRVESLDVSVSDLMENTGRHDVADPGAQSRFENSEIRIMLEQKLEFLTHQQREAILLHVVLGRTYQSSGDLIGVTREAMRQRASRGLRRLRKLFAEEEAKEIFLNFKLEKSSYKRRNPGKRKAYSQDEIVKLAEKKLGPDARRLLLELRRNGLSGQAISDHLKKEGIDISPARINEYIKAFEISQDAGIQQRSQGKMITRSGRSAIKGPETWKIFDVFGSVDQARLELTQLFSQGHDAKAIRTILRRRRGRFFGLHFYMIERALKYFELTR